MTDTIKVKKFSPDVELPTRGSEFAAGLDLATQTDATLKPGQRALLPTGLAFAIPEGKVGLIWPRSKLAAKMGTDILAGVVDADYRGEVHVSIINLSGEDLELRKGDKIAQMLIQDICLLPLEEVEVLDETERGASGITDSELRLRG